LDGGWQARMLDRPVGSLEPPDAFGSDTWLAAQRVAEAFLEAGVAAPLFGLPVIASALNVAVNLYGQEFLAALHERPEAARHDLGVINRVLCDLHRWYLRRVPLQQLQPVVSWQRTQPPGFGQLCGCSTQLVSGEMYGEFIAALDDALLSTYPMGGMIHLCGTHTQHIPVWRGMRRLRAVQINDRAAEDLQVYLRGLRPDQVIYVNPCRNMPVERIMDITGGERVVVVAEVAEPLRTADARR